MKESEHWKNYFQQSTLQDNNFNEKSDTIVTITSVQMQELQTAEGKQMHLCAMLAGFDKPLRINKTIAKNMSKALQSNDPQSWVGKQVSIYVQKGLKAFGQVFDVPRVRPIAPRVNIDVNLYFAEMEQCTTVDQLKALWAKLPANVKGHQQIVTKFQTTAKQLKGDK